jgi:hypothetical protein
MGCLLWLIDEYIVKYPHILFMFPLLVTVFMIGWILHALDFLKKQNSDVSIRGNKRTMGKEKVNSFVFKLFAVIVLLLLMYLAALSVASLRKGYSWSEMDWEQKGSTSLIDFLAASDIGKREILKDGRMCVEYYAYKDGLPIKTVCPKTEGGINAGRFTAGDPADRCETIAWCF